MRVCIFGVAALIAAVPLAHAQSTPPPDAPSRPVPSVPMLTWMGIQMSGSGEARLAWQLSVEPQLVQSVVDSTLVLRLPKIALDPQGTWGPLDLRAYEISVATIRFGKSDTDSEVHVTFVRPGAAAPRARVERGRDGYHYIVLDVDRDGVKHEAQNISIGGMQPHVATTTLVAIKKTAPPAVAADVQSGPTWRDDPRLYMSASLGFNAPAGAYGLEIDYRVARLVSVGVAGGYGVWGPRAAATVKLENHLSSKSGVFIEGAIAGNFGGSGTASTDNGDMKITMGFVPTANIALGARTRRWGPFWTGARIGATFALLKDRYSVTGGELDPLTKEVIEVMYPGVPAYMFSWMAGMAF